MVSYALVALRPENIFAFKLGLLPSCRQPSLTIVNMEPSGACELAEMTKPETSLPGLFNERRKFLPGAFLLLLDIAFWLLISLASAGLSGDFPGLGSFLAFGLTFGAIITLLNWLVAYWILRVLDLEAIFILLALPTIVVSVATQGRGLLPEVLTGLSFILLPTAAGLVLVLRRGTRILPALPNTIPNFRNRKFLVKTVAVAGAMAGLSILTLPPSDTRLHELTAYSPDLAAIKAEIESGTEVNARSSFQGNTALHNAARHGNGELIRLLVDAGANVNARNEYENTPLHVATKWGWHPESAKPESSTRNNAEVVEILIAAGSDVHAQDFAGDTPLHGAAMAKDPGVIQALIDGGADISAKSDRPWSKTPLSTAAMHGEPEIVFALVHLGANVNARENDGRTPLHYAANFGEPEVVNVLILSGATVDARDDSGQTPLHRAAGRHFRLGRKPADLADDLFIMAALIAAGADPDARDEDGKTPLDIVDGNLDNSMLSVFDEWIAMQRRTDDSVRKHDGIWVGQSVPETPAGQNGTDCTRSDLRAEIRSGGVAGKASTEHGDFLLYGRIASDGRLEAKMLDYEAKVIATLDGTHALERFSGEGVDSLGCRGTWTLELQ